jgi:hypothetical protein
MSKQSARTQRDGQHVFMSILKGRLNVHHVKLEYEIGRLAIPDVGFASIRIPSEAAREVKASAECPSRCSEEKKGVQLW